MSNSQVLTRTLTIPSYKLELLEATLKKLGKKATKLGCKSPSYKVLREFTKDVSADPIRVELVGYSEVEVSYEILAVAGSWHFQASIETVDRVDGVARNRVNGPNLSEEVAKSYITVEQKCDHCQHNRKRNQTYIVRNTAGETKQIGSSCLVEYLGVDPAAAVAGLEFDAAVKTIGEDDEVWGRGSNAPRVWALADVAAIALSLIAKNGFVSAASAEFGEGVKTGSDMLTYLVGGNPHLKEWYASVAPTAANREAAAVIVERLNSRILSDYRNAPGKLDSFSFKLGLILNRGFADYKDFQLLASSINREATDIAKANVGGNVKRNELMPGAVEGGKLEFKATIQSTKGIETAWGSSTLVTFVSESGHIAKTFTTSQQEFNPGSIVTVKGTVKKLEVSEKFGSSIMLTRVKIVA